MGRKIDVEETVKKYFNFCQVAKQFLLPPSKWRPRHVPCLPYPRYATQARNQGGIWGIYPTPKFSKHSTEILTYAEIFKE